MTLDSAVQALALLSTLALGLSAGALVAEAGLLVPMWRAQAPADFLAWYRRNAALLVAFFAPLEIAAVALSALALLANVLHPVGSSVPLGIAFALTLGVLIAFPLYFQKANASFATGSISLERLPDELRRWARWHWARTTLAGIAFAAAAIALRS